MLPFRLVTLLSLRVITASHSVRLSLCSFLTRSGMEMTRKKKRSEMIRWKIRTRPRILMANERPQTRRNWGERRATGWEVVTRWDHQQKRTYYEEMKEEYQSDPNLGFQLISNVILFLQEITSYKYSSYIIISVSFCLISFNIFYYFCISIFW